MGVVTLAKVTDYTVSNKRYRVRDVTFSSSYATGGDLFVTSQATASQAAQAVGLHKVEEAEPLGPATNGTLKFDVSYDYTNGKLKAWGTNAVPGAAVGDPEVTAATNLSAYVVRVRFSGF